MKVRKEELEKDGGRKVLSPDSLVTPTLSCVKKEGGGGLKPASFPTDLKGTLFEKMAVSEIGLELRSPAPICHNLYFPGCVPFLERTLRLCFSPSLTRTRTCTGG